MFNIYKICRFCFLSIVFFTKNDLVLQGSVDTIQARWETFIVLCGKFIQDTTYQTYQNHSVL